MAWHFNYDHNLCVGVLVASGQLSNTDLSTAIITASLHPKFYPRPRILYDYVQLAAAVHPPDVLFSERGDQFFSGNSRRAFLVSPPLQVAFADYLRSRATTGAVQVFSDRATALDWLHEGTPPWHKMI